MKWTIALLVAIAATILALSAAFFDGATVAVIAGALVIVGFFSGSAVVLGVLTRRMSRRGDLGQASDHAEVIADEPPAPRH